MRKRLGIAGAVAGAALVAGTLVVPALASAGSSTGLNGWGCDTGSSRTLEHFYTVESNFYAYYHSQGDKCPNGFPVPGVPAPPAGSHPAPLVTTSAATSVSASAATLNGTVNPEGAPTTYQFQYGTTTAYGSAAPATAASAGNGTSAVSETASLTGLTASATYHFRVVATNASGTTDGPDETFTTTASSGGGGTGTYTCNSTYVANSDNGGGGCPSSGQYAFPGYFGGAGDQAGYVIHDVWNYDPSYFNSEQLGANSMSDWNVTANIKTGNWAVLSYPDAQDTLTTTSDEPTPLSDLSTLTSTYSDTMPAENANSDNEAAYDIWMGAANEQSWTGDQEIMIWTDNYRQTPAGSDTGQTWTDASTGTTYEIWTDLSGDNPQNTVTFVAKSNQTSGSVDLSALFNYMVSDSLARGWASAPGVDQIDYGMEYCSTGGQNGTFTVNNLTLNSTGTTPNVVKPKAMTPASTGFRAMQNAESTLKARARAADNADRHVRRG